MRFGSKASFRKFCKERVLKRNFDKRVVSILADLLKTLTVQRVLFYLPMKHEPAIGSLLYRLKGSLHIYLPKIAGESFEMALFRYPLQRGPFGIKEPRRFLKKAKKIDLAVVPVLGVDGDFRRIGFGKGMYDRFFASLNYRPIIVFVQNKKCFTKESLADRYDIQGDFLITPNEILIRGNSDVGRDFSRKFCRYHKRRCRIYPLKKSGKRATRSL